MLETLKVIGNPRCSPTRSPFQFSVTQRHIKATYNRSFTPTT